MKTAGTPDALNLVSSALFPDGSVVIAGNTSSPQGDKDVLITKYTADGGLLWQQTFGGTAGGNDYGIAVRVDGNDAVIVTGTVINGGTAEDIAVAKYDAWGTLEWRQDWDGGAGLMDFPAALAVDAAGDIYVAGTSTSQTTAKDYAVLKYKYTGTLLWSSAYNYVANLQDYATSLMLNGSGDAVVTGASAASATVWEYATAVFNGSSGAQTAVSRIGFPGVGIDEPSAIAKDANGNTIVVGTADSNGNKNIRTVKFSPSLAVLWSRSFDGYGLEVKGLSIGVSGGGDVYVAGYTEKNPGVTDFITLKYSDAGTLLWNRQYQSETGGSAKASQLMVTPNDGCKVVGAVETGGDGQVRAIGYTASGDLEWEGSYNTMGMDGATSVLLDGDAVYVSGITQGLTGNNYATIKYTVYQDRNPYHLSSAGIPDYRDHELIISFHPNIVNPSFVNNRDLEFASLPDVLPDSVISAMSAALNVDLLEHRIIITKIHRRLTPADTISISRLGDTVKVPPFWADLVMTLPPTLNIPIAVQNIGQLNSFIVFAEPNYAVQPCNIPNDPEIGNQQSLIPSTTYPNAHINMNGAWNIETGRDYIKVGVYDYPVYWAHRDFGNGTFVGSKVKGDYDYFYNTHISNQNFPDASHGTACAGVIGALRNNSKDIAGIAGGDLATNNTGVSLYSLGIFGPFGFISWSVAAEAIVSGASSLPISIPQYGYGLHIQNHSWASNNYSQAGNNAVVFAFQNQCIVVASRSNDSSAAPRYPACFRDEYVLNVGASGTDGRLKNNSNGAPALTSSWGERMDFLAPGARETIKTTGDPNIDGHVINFGMTSAATPHVAGVAALMCSRHNTLAGAANSLAPEDVENILQSTATDIVGTATTYPVIYDIGYDEYSGWGRINATAALQAIDWPQRHVFHSSAPQNTTVTDATSLAVYFPDGVIDYTGGGYYDCIRYKVTHTYQNTFPNGSQILGTWPRYSSSTGCNNSTTNNGNVNVVYTMFSVNQNTVTTTAFTFVYLVVSKQNSPPLLNLPKYHPCAPLSAKTAYSVHVYNPAATTIASTPLERSFTIFPNPTSNDLTVQYRGESLQNPVLEFSDIAGKYIYRQAFAGNYPSLKVQLNTVDWSAGIYLCKLSASNAPAITQKISKQ